MSNTTNAVGGGLIPLRFAGGAPVDTRKCDGKHAFYIAEVIYVQKDGKVHVVNVCRSCGIVAFHEKQISSPGAHAEFLKEKAKEQDNVL